MRIDKRKRYREFFEDVNTKLRLHMLTKVFDVLFIISMRIKKFKRVKVFKLLESCFKSLVETIKRSMFVKKILGYLKAKNQAKTKTNVFYNIHYFANKNRALR